MKYRTSYGQNCLQHSKEVAWLAGMMAAEIGADVKLAKRMRPAPRHRQGADPRAGGQPPRAVAAGADQVQRVARRSSTRRSAATRTWSRRRSRRCWPRPPTASRRRGRAPAATCSRATSSAWPSLEEIACSYKGVEMCYAIQAGRELRIMTKSDQISDLDAHQLAKDISKRIEAEMQYPGHIKVTVIRETARPSSRAKPWPPGCSGTLGEMPVKR